MSFAACAGCARTLDAGAVVEHDGDLWCSPCWARAYLADHPAPEPVPPPEPTTPASSRPPSPRYVEPASSIDPTAPAPRHRGRDRWHAVAWAAGVGIAYEMSPEDVVRLALDHDEAANDPPLGPRRAKAIAANELKKAEA